MRSSLCIHFWIVWMFTLTSNRWSRKDTKQSVNQLTKCISRTHARGYLRVWVCLYWGFTHPQTHRIHPSIHTESLAHSLARSLTPPLYGILCGAICIIHMRFVYIYICWTCVQCRALARWQKRGCIKQRHQITHIYSQIQRSYTTHTWPYTGEQQNFIDLIRMQRRRCTRALNRFVTVFPLTRRTLISVPLARSLPPA